MTPARDMLQARVPLMGVLVTAASDVVGLWQRESIRVASGVA